MNWKLKVLLLGILAVVVSAAIPTKMHMSNCGGNSAALSQVRSIDQFALICADEAAGGTFEFTAADDHQREELASDARNDWLHDAHFLVSTLPIVRTEAQQRKIVVVCDKPYRNVPQQTFGSAPPTHAAGYSDGSPGLISTKEFAALDLSHFKALDELFPPLIK